MVAPRIVFAVEAAADQQLGRRIVVARPASSSACRCGIIVVVVVVVVATIIFSADAVLEKRRVKTRALCVCASARALAGACACERALRGEKKIFAFEGTGGGWVTQRVARKKSNLYLYG